MKSRILAVDDHATNLAILQELLEDDYDLTTAESGEEALELAPACKPDLILLDVMMPGIDGYEVCRRLRQSHDCRAKIIMLSARAMPEERIAGYDAGADDYVTKPFNADELLAKVSVYLKLKSVEEINDVKRRLLEMLQHSDRTPLTGILSASDILASDCEMDLEERREMAQSIGRAARRLFAWLEKGERLVELKTLGLPPAHSRFDLVEELRRQVEAVSPQLDQRQIELDLQLAGSPLMLRADVEELERALSALLEHACERTSDGGKMTVSLFDDEGRIQLEVTDQGEPVGAVLLQQYFEPFADPMPVLFNQGHGMDLAIARQIVRAYGGTMEAEQTSGGLTIRVSLPISREEADPVELIEEELAELAKLSPAFAEFAREAPTGRSRRPAGT